MPRGLAAAFHSYERVTKGLNSLFVILASFLALIIVVVVVATIVSRGLGVSLLWANDVAQFSFVYLFFLSLGPALQSGHHMTVELFEPLVPQALRRYLDHVAAIACIVFGVVFLVQLWRLTGRSFADNRLALAAITIELKWVQVAGPIGALQFVLTAIMNLGLAQKRLSHGQAPAAEVA